MHFFGVLQLFTAVSSVTAATFMWNCTNSAATCNNACYAMRNGLAPSTLTYDSDPANRTPRRTKSGCNRTPCSNAALPWSQKGNSCDEFPFASTFEGGTGAILRCVDSKENSSEGGQLSAFYKTISHNTKFNIMMNNYNQAPFCVSAGPWPNDGGQFKLANGAFVNAKLRRGIDDVGVFTDAQPQGTPVTLREFEDQNGEKLLSLDPEVKEEDLVGTQIWNGAGLTTIVKML
ncbi:hypothetical protein NUW58_g216 [Xylaria curta]|uniref:Uncharacterized protein n=1 Tax=Xylaria curta TaxID=42375 RepID=A0ACC1PRH9_9PEZI|nr:hypothetical protein NUW58_g216 [Xylaria curta]